MKSPDNTLYFNTRDELTKICLDDIMYIGSYGNYIKLNFRSGRTLTLLTSLTNFFNLTKNVSSVHFERLGRSHIVNIAYLSQINTIHKTVILVDDQTKMSLELKATKDAIIRIRKLFMDLPQKKYPDFNTKIGSMHVFQITS